VECVPVPVEETFSTVVLTFDVSGVPDGKLIPIKSTELDEYMFIVTSSKRLFTPIVIRVVLDVEFALCIVTV
jgi:hypothetical protein